MFRGNSESTGNNTDNNRPEVGVNNVGALNSPKENDVLQDTTIGEESGPSSRIVMNPCMKDTVVTPQVETRRKIKERKIKSISTNKDRDHIQREKESGVKSQITRTVPAVPANVPEAGEVTPSIVTDNATVAGEGVGIQPEHNNDHEQHAVPVPSSPTTSEDLVVLETSTAPESVDLSNTDDVANNNAQSDLQVAFGENEPFDAEHVTSTNFSESVLLESDHDVIVGGDHDLPYSIAMAATPTGDDDAGEQTGEIENDIGGCSFKLCNIKRLKRFLVIGSENGTFICSTRKLGMQNIKCVEYLIKQGCYQKVIETVAEYSRCGRVVKEDPVLTVLSLCAEHDFEGMDEVQQLEVRKFAYDKVSQICNIPTKLFRFLDLTQDKIKQKRIKSLPTAQRNQSIKPKKHHKQPSVSSENEPNKVQPKFKKVHKDGRRSLGWGKLRRKCVAKFYEDEGKDATRLLYLLTKYRRRYKFSQKLVIRWAHPKMVGENEKAKNLVLRYISKGFKNAQKWWENLTLPIEENTSEVIDYIKIIEEVKTLSSENPVDEERLLDILKVYGKRNKPKEFTTCTTLPGDQPKKNADGKKGSIQIVREHIPTEFLKCIKVWEALIRDKPMTALIRNLGKMSSIGLFDDACNVEKAVCCLKDRHKLKTARVHPMKILIGKSVYESGHGEKGGLQWDVNEEIVNALEEAYYLSFKQAEEGGEITFKTGKKFMLCLSLSNAMSKKGCYGCKTMTPAMASAAMAWQTWHIEGEIELVACGDEKVLDMKMLGFTKEMQITEVLHQIETMKLGATGCSLPMTYALEKRLEIDVFVIYCDSQPNFLANKPKDELLKYNTQMNRCAKLIVCGMQSTGFTIADPLDPNMLDIVGFDTDVPEIIRAFSSDEINGLCGDECHECHPRDER